MGLLILVTLFYTALSIHLEAYDRLRAQPDSADLMPGADNNAAFITKEDIPFGDILKNINLAIKKAATPAPTPKPNLAIAAITGLVPNVAPPAPPPAPPTTPVQVPNVAAFTPPPPPPPPAFQANGNGCPRPSTWCTHDGAKYSSVDCDADGRMDNLCIDDQGHVGVIATTRNCADTWPSGKPTDCDDECALGTHKCDPLTQCVNKMGGYSCTNCPSGYQPRSGIDPCEDIDECLDNNGGCDPMTTCENTKGGRKCGDCPKPGYYGSGEEPCKDVNECASQNGGCDPLQQCANNVGGFTCGDCPVGYQQNAQKKCEDVNECDSNNGGCHAMRQCVNTRGSFYCEKCKLGYVSVGSDQCTDLDECAINNGRCDSLTTCTNLEGTRRCGPCPIGYSGTGENGCEDINECEEEDDDDDENKNAPAGDEDTTDTGGADQGDADQSADDQSADDQSADQGAAPADQGAAPADQGAAPADQSAAPADQSAAPADQGGADQSVPAGGDVQPSFLQAKSQTKIRANAKAKSQAWLEARARFRPGGKGGCDPLVACINTPGSRTCGKCPPGYAGDGENGCISPDERMTKWERAHPDLPSIADSAAKKSAQKTAMKMETAKAEHEAQMNQDEDDAKKAGVVDSLNERVKNLQWKTQSDQEARQELEDQLNADAARKHAADMQHEAEKVLEDARQQASRIVVPTAGAAL